MACVSPLQDGTANQFEEDPREVVDIKLEFTHIIGSLARSFDELCPSRAQDQGRLQSRARTIRNGIRQIEIHQEEIAEEETEEAEGRAFRERLRGTGRRSLG